MKNTAAELIRRAANALLKDECGVEGPPEDSWTV